VIRVIAVLCRLSAPTECHDQTVTTSELADISMQACLMGAPALAEFMRGFPQYRLSKWRCVLGTPVQKEHA